MPYRAKIAGVRVESTLRLKRDELFDLQQAIKEGRTGAACLYCGEPMHIRAIDSQVVSTHFAHYSKSETCRYDTDRDFRRHEDIKAALEAELLSGKYDVATVGQEVTVSIEGGKRATRRVDVLSTSSRGVQTAHEIQISAISTIDLEIRTADYHLAGINVYWWLGDNADTASNRYFLQERGIKWGIIAERGHLGKEFVFIPGASLRPPKAPGREPGEHASIKDIMPKASRLGKNFTKWETAKLNHLRSKGSPNWWGRKMAAALESGQPAPDYYESEEYKAGWEKFKEEWYEVAK